MKRNSFVTVLVVLCLALPFAIVFLRADVSSEAEPTRLEAWVASGLLSAKLHMSDHQRESPISGSISGVDKGEQMYQEQCSICHGKPWGKPGMLARSFSPRPPQFGPNPPKRASWMNAYLIRHGIRWSAMPSSGHLSDADAWRIAMYLDTLKSTPRQHR